MIFFPAALVSILVFVASVNGQTKILVTNDDGWAVANIRAQYNSLKSAGFNVSLLLAFDINVVTYNLA